MKLLRNTTAILCPLYHRVPSFLMVGMVKHIQSYPCWGQTCSVRYSSNGNDSSGEVKDPGSNNRTDQSKNTISQSKVRRPTSPADRLAGILPTEYQETALLGEEDKKKHEASNSINRTNKSNSEHDNNCSVCSDANSSAGFGKHGLNELSFEIKWTNSDSRKGGSLSSDYDDSHAKKTNKIHLDDIAATRADYFRRKRSLSPLQRFSEQITEDFWSDQNQDARSIIDALKEVDSKNESDIRSGNGTFRLSSNLCSLNSECKLNEEHNHMTTPTFQFGCYVTLCLNGWSRIPRKYVSKLEKGKTFRIKSYGQLCHDDIEGKIAGQLLTVSPSKMVAITYPTLEEYVTMIPRKTITANSKTINMMMSMAGLWEGSRVLEAGTGSGATTLFLSRAVGVTGHVISVEKRSRYSELAQENVSKWWDHCSRLGHHHNPNVTFVTGDVTLPQTFESPGDLQDLDAVFLDMKNPSEALTNIMTFVRLGGAVMIYCPSLSTVLSCVKKINDNSLPLKVQGVYEDTEKLWDIKCLADTDNQTDVNRMICRPCQCDERKTVFVLNLIKIAHKTNQDIGHYEIMKDTTQNTKSLGSRSSSPRNFIYGDHVLVEYLYPKKDGKDYRYLTSLKENGEFPLRERHVKHSEVVGLMPGTVLSVQWFPALTVKRPMLNSYVESFFGNGKNVRHFQHISFIGHSLDVMKGNTILHLGMDSNQSCAYALYLSQAVGKEGKVYCLTESETDHLECTKRLCTWREMYYQNTTEHYPQNVHFSVLDDPEKNFPHLSSVLFDGVSADVPLPVLIGNLSFITNRLKSGSHISVFFTSLTSVLHLFHWLGRSDLPLSVKSIHEETEREWIVQPVKANNSTAFHEREWPYICRPKQNMRKSPGFIVNILKAWKMR